MNLKKGIIRLVVYFLIFLSFVLASVLYLFIRTSHEIPELLDFFVRNLLSVSALVWAFGLGIVYVTKGFADDKNVETNKLRRNRIILCVLFGVLMIIWGLIPTVQKDKNIYIFIIWCFFAVLIPLGIYLVFKKRNML